MLISAPQIIYEAIQESRCISYCFDADTEFLDDADKMLIEMAKLSTCEEYHKYIGILINEMHIELLHSKNKGCLTGFANFGNVSEHLLMYQKALSSVKV